MSSSEKISIKGWSADHWPIRPIPICCGQAPSAFYVGKVLDGIEHINTYAPGTFVVVDQPPTVGVHLRYTHRDPEGRRFFGGVFGWFHDEGNPLLYRRAWVCLHPHLVPHRINEVLVHELGHVLGYGDSRVPDGDIMDPRHFLGGSWDAHSEFLQAHNLGVHLHDRDPREGIEVLGRAITIAAVQLDDAELLARAYASIAGSYLVLDDAAAAEEALSRAAALTRSDWRLARIELDRARAADRVAGFRQSLPFLQRARDAGRRLRSDALLASIALQVGLGLGAHGHARWAKAWYVAAHDAYACAAGAASEDEHPRLLAQAANALLLAEIVVHNWTAAESLLGMHEAALAPFPYLHGSAWVNFGRGMMAQRLFRRAAVALRLSMRAFARVGNDAVPYDVVLDAAWCSLAVGDLDAAAGSLHDLGLMVIQRNWDVERYIDVCCMAEFFHERTGRKEFSVAPEASALRRRLSPEQIAACHDRVRSRAEFFLGG